MCRNDFYYSYNSGNFLVSYAIVKDIFMYKLRDDIQNRSLKRVMDDGDQLQILMKKIDSDDTTDLLEILDYIEDCVKQLEADCNSLRNVMDYNYIDNL